GISIYTDLSWTCSDPDGDPLTYDVYFGVSSSPPLIASNISATTYDPGTLSYETLYYWKIVAWDNHGLSTEGPLWHFTTIYIPNRPPYAPHSPSPANGSTDVSVNIDLSWVGGDPDSGDFVTYDVYFGTAFPLTKILSNISGTSHTLHNLSYSTKYYWKIIAWDNHQNTNTSPVWSFATKTDTTPPSIQLTSPSKGYLYLNFGDIIIRKIPIFFTTIVIGRTDVTATVTDSQSGVKKVEFYIEDELKASFTTEPYSWAWTESGYLFPYVLKVLAYDNAGNQNSYELKLWKIF
ncbi:MAG: Ig-like domain-containing protein, partial [Euryarchaeota archaeon]|nr:Ig-like domain-containing protein [Euryarchaeota archaeon]